MRKRAQRAFTLIEVLVVVVIVGIISSIVVLSAGLVDDDRNVREEARRIASLLELAADEALLQGRDFGIEFAQSGYRFVEYDPYTETWVEVAGDDLLRARKISSELRFELSLEGRRVMLNAELADLGQADPEERNERAPRYAPHALIMSSGQLSPFNLAMIRDRDRREFHINVELDGSVELDLSNTR